MNEYEFKYIFKDTTSDLIITEYFTLKEIEEHEVYEFILSESEELGSNIELIARNLYTGQTDSSEHKIYTEDIIEYLGREVKDGKQIYPKRRMVVENNIESLYKLSCITASLQGIIIGNIHENPELTKENTA